MVLKACAIPIGAQNQITAHNTHFCLIHQILTTIGIVFSISFRTKMILAHSTAPMCQSKYNRGEWVVTTDHWRQKEKQRTHNNTTQLILHNTAHSIQKGCGRVLYVRSRRSVGVRLVLECDVVADSVPTINTCGGQRDFYRISITLIFSIILIPWQYNVWVRSKGRK